MCKAKGRMRKKNRSKRKRRKSRVFDIVLKIFLQI
jgi:hypothetical protein